MTWRAGSGAGTLNVIALQRGCPRSPEPAGLCPLKSRAPSWRVEECVLGAVVALAAGSVSMMEGRL